MPFRVFQKAPRASSDHFKLTTRLTTAGERTGFAGRASSSAVCELLLGYEKLCNRFTLDKSVNACHIALVINYLPTQQLQFEPLAVSKSEASQLDPATRSLHAVDVENLLGGTSFTEGEVATIAAAYRVVAGVASGDLVVVSSSYHTAAPTWFGWGNARRVVRSGPSGADLALLDVLETENVSVRFDRVVIASGDGIFALPAAQLQAQGVAVTIVCRRCSLSRELAFAARDVRYIDPVPQLPPAVALRVA